MRLLVRTIISAVLLTAGLVYAQEKVNSCVSCHLEMGEELAVPVEGMKEDVHAQQGESSKIFGVLGIISLVYIIIIISIISYVVPQTF
jgi:hypothetical protein